MPQTCHGTLFGRWWALDQRTLSFCRETKAGGRPMVVPGPPPPPSIVFYPNTLERQKTPGPCRPFHSLGRWKQWNTTTRGGKKPFSLAPPLRAVGTFPAAGGSVPVQKSLKNVFGQMATREFFQTPLIRRPKSRCRGGVPGSPPPGGRGD